MPAIQPNNDPVNSKSSPLISQKYKFSLRTQISLSVALPIIVLLSAISFYDYYRERQSLESYITAFSLQISEIMTGSLKHAMLDNNPGMIDNVLTDVSAMDNVKRVQLINLDGEVKGSTHSEDINQIWKFSDPACWECHKYPGESRPQVAKLSNSSGYLRVSSPIKNEPQCLSCHEEGINHLGVLIVDVSLVNLEEQLLNKITRNLILSISAALFVATIAYFMIQILVVKRIEAMSSPIAALRAGYFNTRVPMRRRKLDELDELADGLNHMAAEIERHEQEQEKRTQVREKAISEERDRIARELHDGFSQLLSFINTKTSAVRLLLQNKQFGAAEKLLRQLEEATQNLFLDVREAILGLKISDQVGENLGIALKECTERFSRFSDLPVEMNLDPQVENLSIDAETELHLLRIVQESLTNIRKHARASEIQIDLKMNNGGLDLAVCDDGKGFDSKETELDGNHFGLSTMHERATAIGAQINIWSEIGIGTCVKLQLPLMEN